MIGTLDHSTTTLALIKSDKLENMQLEAARIVTGGTKLASIIKLMKLYNETGWELLSEL